MLESGLHSIENLLVILPNILWFIDETWEKRFNILEHNSNSWVCFNQVNDKFKCKIIRTIVVSSVYMTQSCHKHKSEKLDFKGYNFFNAILYQCMNFKKPESNLEFHSYKTIWVQTFFSYFIKTMSISQDFGLRGGKKESNNKPQWETQEMRLVRKFFQALHV